MSAFTSSPSRISKVWVITTFMLLLLKKATTALMAACIPLRSGGSSTANSSTLALNVRKRKTAVRQNSTSHLPSEINKCEHVFLLTASSNCTITPAHISSGISAALISIGSTQAGIGLHTIEYTDGHFATCETPVSCLYRAPIYPVREMYRAFHEPCGCPISGITKRTFKGPSANGPRFFYPRFPGFLFDACSFWRVCSWCAREQRTSDREHIVQDSAGTLRAGANANKYLSFPVMCKVSLLSAIGC